MFAYPQIAQTRTAVGLVVETATELVVGTTVAGAPTGEHTQAGEQTQTTFWVIVKAIVKVDVTAAEEACDVGVADVVEDELELGVVVVDLVVLEVVGVAEDTGVVVLVLVLLDVAGAEDVDDRVVDELVAAAVLELELATPGALPTTDPVHAFQLVIPLRHVVEMD